MGHVILWRVPPRASATLVAASILLLAGCGGCGNGPRDRSQASSSSAAGDGSAVRAAAGVRLRRIGTFESPVFATAPPGDTHRLFVVERDGRIRVVRDGKKLGKSFLDISPNVSTDSERGLLSMAFARDYASSRRFYIYFTDNRGDIHIQEGRRSASNPDVASRSRRNLLTIAHHEFPNHDGGQLQIGPDNRLYAGIGDGGSGGDPHNHGQSLGTHLGKLLRIDPRKPSGGRAYGVKGNPFASRRGARPAIWAFGLRNPWRFSFDRSTGDLVIADVGQNTQEEIDFARRGTGRGANYGWNVFEGRLRFRSGTARRAVRPRVVHSHSNGYCSITGGYVVRDRALGSLFGRYVYGDLCKPALRSVKLGRRSGATGNRTIGVSVQNLVSFGEDARGRVYAVSIDGGVFRLVPR
jgi:glucose/arabinose dehydrogenase